MFIKMATGIIIALLIAICLTAVKSYLKKLAHGCCGAGGDEEKRSKSKHDLSDCKYRYDRRFRKREKDNK